MEPIKDCKHEKTQHDVDEYDKVYEWCEICGEIITPKDAPY